MQRLRGASATGAAVAAVLLLAGCRGTADRTPLAIAQAEWIVRVGEGSDPATARAPAAGDPYGPGSLEIKTLRSVAAGLVPNEEVVLWKGHWNAVVGTTSGERLRLRISVYGGFFVDEDSGRRFVVAPRDRPTWDQLWSGQRPPRG